MPKSANPYSRIERVVQYSTAIFRRKPYYLALGVQKSATSKLYNMLSQHPNIHNPRIKELHYHDNKYSRSSNGTVIDSQYRLTS